MMWARFFCREKERETVTEKPRNRIGDFGFFVSRKWGLRSIRIQGMTFEDVFDYLGAGLDPAWDPDLGLFRCKKSVFLFLPREALVF